MIAREKLRERFLRDPLPLRLGGLAATFGRISSSARRSSDPAVVADLLEEARRLIEWTAGEVEPEAAGELVHIQILLTLWQKTWESASRNSRQRLLLSLQTRDWSDKALAFSGLA
jgi:hypothetical protein